MPERRSEKAKIRERVPTIRLQAIPEAVGKKSRKQVLLSLSKDLATDVEVKIYYEWLNAHPDSPEAKEIREKRLSCYSSSGVSGISYLGSSTHPLPLLWALLNNDWRSDDRVFVRI